jgi:HK97 family phage major capsid protein
MAQTSPTNSSQFAAFLSPNEAAPYFESARRNSVVQSLARQVPLGINGEQIPVSTTKATAGWVSEGGRKPSTEAGLAVKTMTPEKIAAISVVSAEIVRANPGNYMEILRSDITESIGLAFDRAVLHGTDSPFDTSLSDTSKTVNIGDRPNDEGGVYADLVDALRELKEDGKHLTGFAFDDITEPDFLMSTDANGRPLFLESPYENSVLSAGRLIGRQAYLGAGIADDAYETVGFAGDWSQVIWGAVGGINFDVSTEATVTINGELISLWENNLVAIRAETEFGVLINDTDAFVQIGRADEALPGGE